LVQDYFGLQGYKVSTESRGDLATQRILQEKPDIVVLDVMLPGKNGIQICKELRMETDVPVLMLTALTDDIDQIVGLEVGADDYLCKPVQPRLLLAHVSALLRRAKSNPESNKKDNALLKFGGLQINPNRQQVHLHGEEITLTTNELTLLCQFAVNADQILSRDELLNHLRGFGYDGLDRTVDMLVSRLRKKLQDNPSKPQKIKTIWKKGYLFVSDAWE
jgi:DNA-binding response OmpR family regulator